MDWPVFAASLGYGLLHSLLAADKIKRWFGVQGSGALYRIVFNLIALMALFALLWLLWSRPVVPLFEGGIWGMAAGVLLLGAGVLLGWTAFRYYDAGEFLGLWQSTAPTGLHTAGPNAWVRHPLYSATLLLLAGVVLIWPQRAVLSAGLGLVCYLPAGIFWEEKKLLRQFGEKYAAYQKQVKRVIPGIW